MKIKKVYYTKNFAKKASKLPMGLKSEIEEKENLFRRNVFDPSLKTHKLKGKLSNVWSFSITHKYRVLFLFTVKDEVLFFNVGGHEVYG